MPEPVGSEEVCYRMMRDPATRHLPGVIVLDDSHSALSFVQSCLAFYADES